MKIMLLAGLLSLFGCGHVESAVTAVKSATVDRPQQWEHGWKTSRVIATRAMAWYAAIRMEAGGAVEAPGHIVSAKKGTL